MPDEREVITRQMEATRSSLCEKIETLENKVINTVTGATDAVSETIGTVKDTVQETVDAVKGTARDTVESVREAFDIRHQVCRHPWPAVGGAVAVGFLLERLLERETSPRHLQSHAAGHHARSFGALTNGQSYARERPTPVDAETVRPQTDATHMRTGRAAGWLSDLVRQFEPEITRLKAMAIGTGLGVARDLMMQSVPQQLRPGLNDLVQGVTTKLGGETFRPGAFAEASTSSSQHSGTSGVV